MVRIHSILLVIVAALAALVVPAGAANAPAPEAYGRVVINAFSAGGGMAPVVFDHWVHRARYSCRLCHVDIGFGLKANGTGIRAADNMKGLYCGVCHNGKAEFNGKKVFAACSADKTDQTRCDRCHSQGKAVRKEVEFAAFTAGLPKDRFGNQVNWEKAAEDGKIKLIDRIAGISLDSPARAVEKDFAIHAKGGAKADIIFSHRKHVQWNGCEVCHPEIFRGGKRGATQYSMKEINEGKFCGVCHGAVAFPQADCDRCHSKPVK